MHDKQIILELARSLYIWNTYVNPRKESLYYMLHSGSYEIDQKWINLSDVERQEWIFKAKDALDNIKDNFPFTYDSISKHTIKINPKPIWW